MIRVQTIYEMKRLPQPVADAVYVEGIKKLYMCIEGEWIERVYYTTKEIAAIIGCGQRQVQTVIRKLNLRPKILNSSKLNYEQLTVITQAIIMRQKHRHLVYKQIKEDLGV